jgi:hypothetical protein
VTPRECFEIWAPPHAVWSGWAKRVLFAQLESVSPVHAAQVVTGLEVEPARSNREPDEDRDLPAIPDARSHAAVVVDLPGAASLLVGVALARRGYRPVPLYNTTVDAAEVVDSARIAAGLPSAAREIRAAKLPPNAPPAFLLDASRMVPRVALTPGKYDNRWAVFPQDFPSAVFLRSRRLVQAVLLHGGAAPADDLAHVLRRWQEAGIGILHHDRNDAGRLAELRIDTPPRFRLPWYRALAIANLRRSAGGGFGAVIPASKLAS